MMYIETKYYENGRVEAKLHKTRPATEPDNLTTYLDEVDDLQEWIRDNLIIDLDDIVSFVINLEMKQLVDITQYV
jgi:predicted alpha-1,6-mannanase (GH76 family)